MIGSRKRKAKTESKKQLSNDADSKHDHDHAEAAAGIRRIAADKFNNHLMMILFRFIGAILFIVHA